MAKPKDFDLTFGLRPSTETGKKNVRYKVMGEVSESGYQFLIKDPGLTETLDLCRGVLESIKYEPIGPDLRERVFKALERLG